MSFTCPRIVSAIFCTVRCSTQSGVENSRRVDDRAHGAKIEPGLDALDVISSAVVIGVVFDAEVEERNAGGVERAVVGQSGPVVDAGNTGAVVAGDQLHL